MSLGFLLSWSPLTLSFSEDSSRFLFPPEVTINSADMDGEEGNQQPVSIEVGATKRKRVQRPRTENGGEKRAKRVRFSASKTLAEVNTLEQDMINIRTRLQEGGEQPQQQPPFATVPEQDLSAADVEVIALGPPTAPGAIPLGVELEEMQHRTLDVKTSDTTSKQDHTRRSTGITQAECEAEARINLLLKAQPALLQTLPRKQMSALEYDRILRNWMDMHGSVFLVRQGVMTLTTGIEGLASYKGSTLMNGLSGNFHDDELFNEALIDVLHENHASFKEWLSPTHRLALAACFVVGRTMGANAALAKNLGQNRPPEPPRSYLPLD